MPLMPAGRSAEERIQLGVAMGPEPTSRDPSETVATHDEGLAVPQPMPFRLASVGSTCAVTLQLEPPAAGSADESTSVEETAAQKVIDGQAIACTGSLLGDGASVQAAAGAVGSVVVASCGLAPPTPPRAATHRPPPGAQPTASGN